MHVLISDVQHWTMAQHPPCGESTSQAVAFQTAASAARWELQPERAGDLQPAPHSVRLERHLAAEAHQDVERPRHALVPVRLDAGVPVHEVHHLLSDGAGDDGNTAVSPFGLDNICHVQTKVFQWLFSKIFWN